MDPSGILFVALVVAAFTALGLAIAYGQWASRSAPQRRPQAADRARRGRPAPALIHADPPHAAG